MKQDIFFDRNFYLEMLLKHLNDFIEGYRQNLAFIGNELVGKTSIVLHFLNKFIDHRVLPIYVSIEDNEDISSFAKKFIGSLLYNLLNNSGIDLKGDLDYLINKAERFIPQTVKKIKEIEFIINKKKKEPIFLDLLSICDILNKETKKYSLVILDEFHRLEKIGIKNLYKDWAKSLVLQKNTMFIIISSHIFKAKRILGNSLNVLFGKFELIEVQPFDYLTSKEFFIDRLDGLLLENKLVDFLISIAGGIPLYLKVLSDSICKTKDTLSSDTYINKAIIFDILAELLVEENGILNQRFYNYLNRVSKENLDQNVIRILCSISSGYNRLKDINKILHMPIKHILKSISYLIQIDIVTKNGDFFKINDRLFCLWLRLVYQKKGHRLDFNPNYLHQEFISQIEKMYNEFISESNRSILERITEMMYLFENAYVDIDNRRINLATFREIKPFYFESAYIKEGLIARAVNNLWIIGVKQEPLKEKDIEEFSKLCSRYKEKKQKRILITLHQIDTNVRLKAMEERVLVWQKDNLNLLCELFNRPLILD